jgi:hypothetical protein
MNRSSFVRAFGALAAIAAVTCMNLAARADLLTQSELPQVFPVAGPSVGSQSFVDLGTPTVDTGNIDTATVFNVAGMFSTSANVGFFAGYPSSTNFGPVSFNITSGTSLSFSNPTFGSFASSSITEDVSGPGFRTFLVLGNYTSGSFFVTPLSPNPAPASFRIAFTQSPVGTGAISDSATLAIPPVPEPSTMMLAVVGIAGGLVVHQSNRQRRNRTAGVSGGGDDHASTITE